MMKSPARRRLAHSSSEAFETFRRTGETLPPQTRHPDHSKGPGSSMPISSRVASRLSLATASKYSSLAIEKKRNQPFPPAG